MEKKKRFLKRLAALLRVLYHFVHVMLFLSLEFFSRNSLYLWLDRVTCAPRSSIILHPSSKQIFLFLLPLYLPTLPPFCVIQIQRNFFSGGRKRR